MKAFFPLHQGVVKKVLVFSFCRSTIYKLGCVSARNSKTIHLKPGDILTMSFLHWAPSGRGGRRAASFKIYMGFCEFFFRIWERSLCVWFPFAEAQKSETIGSIIIRHFCDLPLSCDERKLSLEDEFFLLLGLQVTVNCVVRHLGFVVMNFNVMGTRTCAIRTNISTNISPYTHTHPSRKGHCWGRVMSVFQRGMNSDIFL